MIAEGVLVYTYSSVCASIWTSAPTHPATSAAMQLWTPPVLLLLICSSAVVIAAIAVCRRINGKGDVSETFTSLSRMHHEMQTLAADGAAAVRRLHEQERLLKAITAAVDRAVFWKDSGGVYRGCNQRFARWLGRDKCEEVVGKTDHELLHDRSRANFHVRCDKEVMQTGVALLNMTETVTHATGARIDLLISKFPLRDADGTIVGIVGVGDDSVHSGVPADPSGKTPLCGGLAAGISHQIRVPLNDIAGFAELLSQEALTPEQARFVEQIVTGADGIRAALEEMLDAPLAPRNSAAADLQSSPPGAFAPQLQTDTDTAFSVVDSGVYTVLIVDDVPENRMLLDVLLKREGYKTVQCSSGTQAVQLCDKDRFDVILMDIQMADMDGLEATKTIRSRGPNTETPILAITAAASFEDEERCLNAGCDDCIRKPIRKDGLMRKVQRFIDRKKQIHTAAAGGEIFSLLSNNPDYQKTIETFVENLPDRIRQMQDAFDAQNLQELALKAHALKGLGGFAGFPIYTELAGSIEQAVHDSHLPLVRKKLHDMVALCRRTRLTPQ